MTSIEEPNIYVKDNVSDTPPPNQSNRRHLLHLIKLSGAPPVAPCHSNPEAVPRPRHRGPQARCGATRTRWKQKPLAEPPPPPAGRALDPAVNDVPDPAAPSHGIAHREDPARPRHRSSNPSTVRRRGPPRRPVLPASPRVPAPR